MLPVIWSCTDAGLCCEVQSDSTLNSVLAGLRAFQSHNLLLLYTVRFVAQKDVGRLLTAVILLLDVGQWVLNNCLESFALVKHILNDEAMPIQYHFCIEWDVPRSACAVRALLIGAKSRICT
jgi:hypothetical protein